MRLDLSDLRLYLHIVDAGSITHGADRAHLSLAAASERLRAMEQALQTRLLERGRRGVAPTAAGEALAHHARGILRQMQAMHGELGQFASGARGRVRLMANTAAISEFLPQRLGPWLRAHPRIDIDLQERTSAETVKAVAAGLGDIGIVSDAVDPGELQLRPFARDHLVLLVPRASALAQRPRMGFAEALEHEFIGLGAGSALQSYIGEQAARIGRTMKLRIRAGTLEGVCQLVAAEVGLGIVPETVARRCARRLPLRRVPLDDAWTRRELQLCFRDAAGLPAAARGLLEYLQAAG